MQEYVLNSENISHERLDGEVLLISFDSGKYFSAKNSAADILWLLENKIYRKNWNDFLSGHFANYAESDIDGFLESLLAEKLIIPFAGEMNSSTTLPNDYSRSEWEIPRLVVFNDLENLLLIDPIHDASTEGWPKKKDE